MKKEEYIEKLYSNRFNPQQKKTKIILWRALIEEFLQKHIGKNSVVLDIGGGYCEFINNIQAREKYLIDINPDSQLFANPDVNVINLNILDIEEQKRIKTSFDRIFISNFFEHLNNKEELIEILLFCFKYLNPGGSILIIQPNFKYSFKEYYDFIDHQLPITHLALQELLHTLGFKIDILIPRFLPYSTKGRPGSPHLLKLYLKLPFIWNLLGGQMFIKASKPT
ncbi:methyltransferase domain protein [Nostoc piscinale CENA21]|uniref:Methyltransferase domain protein n=1 Tax=Nostoc piscinale CENA21 TaxID=224013 RepID=A0A0M4TKR2_9NOSO|nr:methyltransferase domain-containing protein [Nostoc piscinale]ALF53611.1 methyltransferase domain protein [Nostoc piscinale CENA21]